MTKRTIALNGLMACLTLGGVALTGTGCAGDRYQRSTGAYLDDKGVTTRVKTALFRDPVVSGFDVHVDTYRGDVQLSGFVDTPEQKQRAFDVARAVSGVQMVTNNLEVKPPAADTAVGTSGSTVQGSQTMTQPATDYRNNDVPSTRYSPPVNTPETISTPSTSRSTYTPNLEPSPSPNLQNAPANIPNPTLPGNTGVSSFNAPPNTLPAFKSNVDISTSNGRATLRGNVTSESERQSVEKKVREIPGIQAVDNQLQVLGPR